MLRFIAKTHQRNAHMSNVNCNERLFAKLIRAALQKHCRTSIEVMPRDRGTQFNKCCTCCLKAISSFRKVKVRWSVQDQPYSTIRTQWLALMQVVTCFKRSCLCTVK